MLATLKRAPLKYFALFLAAGALLLPGALRLRHYLAEKQKAYYTIGIIYNANNLLPEDLEVVKVLMNKRLDNINNKGGLAGRNLKVVYLNDQGSRETVYKVVSENLKDESLIGFVGCWGTSRVQAVTELVGRAEVPFIGGFSVTSIAKDHPNIFTFETDMQQISAVLGNLLKKRATKIAFIGNSNDIYTEALLKEIKLLDQKEPQLELVLEKWIPNEKQFTPETLQHLADSLKRSGADFLVLSTNRLHSNAILGAFQPNKISMPVFSAFIDMQELDQSQKGIKGVEVYDINVFGIPSTLNQRHQQQKNILKNELTPGERLDFQINLGGLFADAIGLLTEAGDNPEPNHATTIRQKISRNLQAYISGRKVFRGWFSDWYFTANRALANEALLEWKPVNSPKPMLAPQQFLQADSQLKEAQVLYARLDLSELSQVSDEAESFYARFFLSIHSEKRFSLDQVDFANAERNEINHKPLLESKLLRVDSLAAPSAGYRYLYRISGKFIFDPDLKKYPFDVQEFPITLQTNNAYQPFMVQPTFASKRDTVFHSPGWVYLHNFIGYDQDLIVLPNKFTGQPQHIPGQRFNFTYVLKRAKVDFYLKVLTPLLAILIITYFSIFIPIREFEAVTAIQVTALLSSIALYFSAYRPAGQFATVSDKIFIFTYVMITTLIGTSVLEYWLYNKRSTHREIGLLINLYEWFLFPLIVVVFTLFLVN